MTGCVFLFTIKNVILFFLNKDETGGPRQIGQNRLGRVSENDEEISVRHRRLEA